MDKPGAAPSNQAPRITLIHPRYLVPVRPSGVVFDAWSAYHLPFLGYPRNTTPYLNTLLDQAVVYHNHISAGNYTTPGTASLLTSSYSWTHRAFNHDVPADQVTQSDGEFFFEAGHVFAADEPGRVEDFFPEGQDLVHDELVLRFEVEKGYVHQALTFR